MGGLKKIVFTVTNDLSYDQRMQKICRSLTKAGYSVKLVGRERKYSIPLTEEPYEQKRLKCTFDSGKLFYAEYNIRLFIYLLFTSFDAACAIDLDTIAAVYFAGKLKFAKLAYDAHEYFTEVPEVIRRPLVKRTWQWVERTFVPGFDLIYTVSDGLAKLFTQKYNKPVHVIMNVPVTTESTVPVVKPEKYILYQGALNEARGLEHLVHAMREIDCKLKLAGEGDLSQYLRELVDLHSLETKVEFLGYVPPQKLKQITAAATIGINLLENKGLSYYYSLSNKFFDYINAGVPQVCIGFPEYKLLNDKYNVALLVKSCDEDEIKQQVKRLLMDKNLYNELQKNCEVCSRQLNWQVEEVKLLGLYEQLFR